MTISSVISPLVVKDECSLYADRSQWPRGLRRGLRPLACWDCAFEFHGGRICLSLMSVVCCQLDDSASGWSFVQRNPTERGVSVCDRETSIMTRPWPTRGYCVIEKIVWMFPTIWILRVYVYMFTTFRNLASEYKISFLLVVFEAPYIGLM